MRFNLLRSSSVLVGIFTLALLLNSCGGNESDESTTLDNQPVVQGQPIETKPDSTDTKADDKAALEAGSYCYRTTEKTIQAIAELLVEPNQAVTGTIEATITNDAESYYSSYQQSLAGVLEDGSLNASITTKIEGSVQKSQETWTLNQDSFSDGNLTLKQVDCEEIIALKADKATSDNPPPSRPKSSSAPAPQAAPDVTPPAKPAPKNEPAVKSSGAKSPIRVKFPQGSTETTLMGQLGAGQNQVYRLNASEGQDMYVKISTNSGAANFDVEVSGGEVIEQQLTDYLDFTLPVGGEYVITVHGGDSGADYSLNIKIQ